MTSGQATKLGWDDFAVAVAAIVHIPVEAAQRDTRLVGDVGLDSLGLTELIVALIIDFEMESLSNGLEERDWNEVTIGSLYDEYLRESEPADRIRIERA